jgi:FkbM family methyltransferase
MPIMSLKSLVKQTRLYAVARKVYRTFRPTVFELNDRYNRQLIEVMRRTLRPDSTALDIGAHRGLILREMFAVAPQGRHFAFEPVPHLAETLIQDYPSARVYCTALSDHSGQATFHYLPNSPEESGLKLHRTHVPNPGNEEFTVTVRRLDEIITEDERIALIKIDAEGAELPIIRGALATIRRCRPSIVFETGRNTTPSYGVGPDDICDTIVGNLGMSLSTMTRWLEGKRPYTRAGFHKEYEQGNEFYSWRTDAVNQHAIPRQNGA